MPQASRAASPTLTAISPSVPVPHPEGLPISLAANRFAIIKIIADSLSGGDNRS
jgi:hypothetical protein